MNRVKFKAYVYEWGEKIRVRHKITSIHLRPMKNKIASCSSRGRLTFDPSLLNKPKRMIDFVVVHELLHLRYPNHGKMFKLLLKAYLCD